MKVKGDPGERGSGIIFKDEIKGGNIPREYIPSVEKGCAKRPEPGFPIGFPIIDFEIPADDGAYHDVDFVGAGVRNLPVAPRCAKPPRRRHPARTDHDEGRGGDAGGFMGDVIGDLNSRRGQIQGTDSRGNAQVVEAMVPLANMFGYEPAALVHPGPRAVHHAVLAL